MDPALKKFMDFIFINNDHSTVLHTNKNSSSLLEIYKLYR